MDESLLLRGVLGSVFGGRRKRSRRALRHLTGGGIGGSLLGTVLSHPAAALTAAGVAWGIVETLQGRQPDQSNQWAGGPPNPAGMPHSAGPLPNQPLPDQPLPNQTWGPLSGGRSSVPPLPPADGPVPTNDVLRLVRLAISAGHADGAMNEHERAAVLQHARAAGVAEVVEQELEAQRPLAEIVGGVTDPAHRATLYVLAFTILRADEQVNGAERIYLAQLANLLNLDPATTQKLEAETGERIDRLGDQDQPGG
jgi:uncharacterized membrane protein YebE (DUF533 family)